MTRPSVPSNPHTGGQLLDTTTLNGIASQTAAGINNSNHDPGDSTNGYGKSIPAIGPSNTNYAAHGPGSGSSDWNTAYEGTAAIPADPTQTAIDPTQAITAAMGIAAENQVIRGIINILLGLPYNTNWGTTPPPSSVALAHLNPSSPDSGDVHTTGDLETDAQLVSNVATGTAPLAVASTTAVANLNADMVDGIHASTAPAAGKLLPLDGYGFFPLSAVEYDSAEDATLDTLAEGVSSQINTNNRIRYALKLLSLAAGLSGSPFDQAATLVTALNVEGNPASGGQKVLAFGAGVTGSEQDGIITISGTDVGADTQGGLTYADLLPDAVVTGCAVSVQSGLTVQMAPGTAYVTGGRMIAQYAEQLTVPANSTSYVWWNGQSLSATSTDVNPGGSIFLATVVAGTSSITSVTDGRFMLKRPRTGGTTAGSSYTANEQAMIQDCVNALRALGLMQ